MKYRRAITVFLNLSLLFFSINAWSDTPGTQKWVFDIGGTNSSPAIGTDGTIYIGGSGNKFYAINPDGTQKWVFTTPTGVSGSPAIGSDGTIYVQSVGWSVAGYLHAINPDGTEKWNLATSSPFWESASCPSFGADGTIYVGTTRSFWAIYPDGTSVSLNFQERCTNGPWTSNPSIGADGTVYIGSCGINQSGVRSIGLNWWHFRDAGEVRSSPAIDSDGTIYVGSESEGGDFYAINPDGTQKWVFDTGTIYSSATIGSDGTIYIRDSGGALYAINPDGTEKWTNHFIGDSTTPSTVAIGDDGTIYYKGYQVISGTGREGLFAINPDGTEKWLFQKDHASSGISSPAIGTDGTIYAVLDDKLFAIYSDSSGLAKSPWPMFNHDAQHTGRYGALPKSLNLIPSILLLLLDE